MRDSQRINNLTICSQIALFGMSYSPLLIIICAKILYSKSEYLHWGGFNLEAVAILFQQFWAVILISSVLVYLIIGTTKLLRKVKQTAFQQFENDYAKVMHGYGKKILFQGGNSTNPYVYFEEFSIFDKSLQSKSATSSI